MSPPFGVHVPPGLSWSMWGAQLWIHQGETHQEAREGVGSGELAAPQELGCRWEQSTLAPGVGCCGDR